MAEIDVTNNSTEVVSTVVKQEEPLGEAHEIGVTSTISALDQGRDAVEEYDKTTATRDVESIIDESNSSTESDRLGLMGMLVGSSETEVIQKDAEDFVNDTNGQSGVLGRYVQKIKSMPSSVGKTEEDIKQMAMLTYTREALGRFQSTGVGETIADIGGVFIPIRKGEAVSDISVSMGFTSGVMDAIKVTANPSPTINRIRNIGLSITDPEEKAAFISAVGDAVELSSDNNLIKSHIMENIFASGSEAGEVLADIVDVSFVGQIGAVVAKTAVNLTRKASTLNTLRKITAYDAIAEAVTVAPKNADFAAKTGISPANASDAVNPLIVDDIALAIQGSSDDTASNVVHLLDLQNSRLSNLLATTEREGVLSSERIEEVMRAAEIAQSKKPGVVGTKVVGSDETGFTLQWGEARFDEVGKPLVTESGKPFVDVGRKQIDFKLKDNQGIKSPIDEYDSFLKSDTNAKMSGKLRNWFVTTVEKLSNQQARTAGVFDDMMKDAFKGLKVNWMGKGVPGRDPRKVDFALMQGAKDAKIYTMDELLTSGVGPNGVRLSEKEATAYYGVRNIVGHMYSLKNKQIADTYSALGINMVDGFGTTTAAKTFDDVSSAMRGWSDIVSDSHYINIVDEGIKQGDVHINLLKLGNKKELTREILEGAYEEGYVLARNASDSSYFKRGSVNTQWGLVRKESVVSPRGQQLLNKIPGYMPKQRTSGYYFIKSEKAGILSGAGKNFKTGETVAWADSSRSADEWIALQDDPTKFTKLFDKEIPHLQASLETAKTHGGMYSGSRKSTELPYVGDQKADFADSFEAMQHYINHIGRQYPASLYRLGSEQRLLEIAKTLGVKDARGVHDVVAKAEASGIQASTQEYKLLESIQNQVKFVNMIPTKAESEWAKRWERIANKLDKRVPLPGWDKVPKFFYNKAQASTHPADLVRGFTFNHLLGMYNPAQILVQASGAYVSFAVAPVQFTKALPKSIGWAMLDNMVADPASQARVIKWMNKKGLGDYADSYELWSRSGYLENVVNSNADYTSVFMKNLPYDSNILQKAVANHTMFYKMGELVNTRLAFGTALEEYKALHKVKHINPNDLDVLESIRSRAEILRLNMSRANQAWFNKGAASVPLQFQQVITKYFEKILPKGFGGTDELTSMEKYRLASVPTALVGVGGIPLVHNVAVEIMDGMGIDPKDLTPAQATNIKFGALGATMNQLLDINVDLSTRTTLAADIPQKLYESITEHRAVWEWLGASGSVAEKYYRNIQYASEAFDLSVLQSEKVDLNTFKFMASVLADAATDIPTLGRNLKQYTSYFFTQNPQFIRDGKYMFDFETMNNRTALFAILGIQPTEIGELYEIDKELNDGRAAMNVFGDTDVSLITRILNLHVLNGGASVKEQEYGSVMINSIMQKYGVMEAQEILNGVWEQTNTKRFDQGNLMWKLLIDSEKKMNEGQEFISTVVSRHRNAEEN